MRLIHGDCLEEMRGMTSRSVDMVLADPPYGTTACKWDSIIDFKLMWEQLKRIITLNGAIVMTSSQPFTTALIGSNLEMFKYCWVWEKSRATNFVHANFQPLKAHEDICVWSLGGSAQGSNNPMVYNPQLVNGESYDKGIGHGDVKHLSGGLTNKEKYIGVNKTGARKPRTVQYFSSDSDGEYRGIQPTQKPVKLFEYLLKTYTNEGDTVLDFCFGSGTTAVACENTGRSFVGIEKGAQEFCNARDRIKKMFPKYIGQL